MDRTKSYLIPGIKVAVWIGALIPLMNLVLELWPGSIISNDPVEMIHHDTGITVLVLLFMTLTVSPVRRMSGWNKIVRFRRLLGMFAFFYVSLHALTYFWLDHLFVPSSIYLDIAEHPWVLAGFSAFVLLIPLAVTSTSGWIRRLGGKRWRRLHALIYLAAMLGVLHFYWLVKKDVSEPVTYAAILAIILGSRILMWRNARPSQVGGNLSTGRARGRFQKV